MRSPSPSEPRKDKGNWRFHGRSGINLSSGQQTHFETGQVPRPNAVNPVVESTISSIAMCRCMRILSNPFRGTSFPCHAYNMQREMHMLCALYIPWSAYVDSCCLSSPMQYSNQTLGPLTKWLKDLYINYRSLRSLPVTPVHPQMKGNEQHSTSFVSRCAQGGWLTRSPCSWMICSASGKTQKDWRILYVCIFLTHSRKCSTRESQRWTTITSCEIQEEKWSPCFKFARRDLSMEWWNIFILVINALRFLTGS